MAGTPELGEIAGRLILANGNYNGFFYSIKEYIPAGSVSPRALPGRLSLW
jgi:hypothetical protein